MLSSIPKKLHLIYKDQNIPDEYIEYFKSIKKFHPDWDIYLYGDSNAKLILSENFPELVNIYDNYKLDIQRTDLFRIVIVYLYGGFYADLDMLFFKSLNPLCHYDLVFAEEKKLSQEECLRLGTKHPLRIANYIFGSVPKHPFWMDMIMEMRKKSDTSIKNENDVLNSTGPGLLTDVYHDKKKTYKLKLVRNNRRKCMKYCETNSCHIGGYAAHLHLGQWRWEI